MWGSQIYGKSVFPYSVTGVAIDIGIQRGESKWVENIHNLMVVSGVACLQDIER
jgi:SPX domain protein involved in polyphosphate accumulation